MPSLNRVQIIGRLGKDPVEKTTPKGTKFVIFSVAVDQHWKSKDGKTHKGVDWFNVEAWGRIGEICLKYLAKGRLVFLEGRLRTNRYEKDGDVKYFTKVIARQMQMLDYQPQDKKELDIPEYEEEISEED
ncbi:MAG: single-stranded DNA-binding protein [Anaerolineaceae bacterium]|nr:single-stranded DNA-binding protein [Anaerolineaceae bacterium]